MKTLKKIISRKIFILSIVLFPALMISQEEGGLGILAGLNFTSNGELVDTNLNIRENASRNVGYHFGLFGKADFGRIFLRPEIKYTHTKSEYTKADLTVDKLDAPLLLGVDLHKHFSIFAGPSLQYIIDTSFGDFSIDEAEDDITVGVQVGVGLNIESLGIDVRYERGLKQNEANISEFTQTRIDTRPDQIILALSINI